MQGIAVSLPHSESEAAHPESKIPVEQSLDEGSPGRHDRQRLLKINSYGVITIELERFQKEMYLALDTK